MCSPSSRIVIASRIVKQRGRDTVGDRPGRVLDRLRVRAQVLRQRRSATAAPSPTRWPRAGDGPTIGSWPRSLTVCGICLLKSRTSRIVGTVMSAITSREQRARTVTSTMPAAVRRCQPVRRFSASTSGLSASASSDAIASDESVRGIDRMNQTAIANSATATASGIAERGSRSIADVPASPVRAAAVGRRWPRVREEASPRRYRTSRWSTWRGRSECGCLFAPRSRSSSRLGLTVLVARDRARRRAGHRVGAHRDGDRRARLSGGRVARALPVHPPRAGGVRRWCCVVLGALGFVGYKIVHDVSDAMSSLQQAAPQRAGELEKDSEFFREIKLKERVTQSRRRDPAAPRGRRRRPRRSSRPRRKASRSSPGSSSRSSSCSTATALFDGGLASDRRRDARRRASRVRACATARARALFFARVKLLGGGRRGDARVHDRARRRRPRRGRARGVGRLWSFLPVAGVVIGALPIVVFAARTPRRRMRSSSRLASSVI